MNSLIIDIDCPPTQALIVPVPSPKSATSEQLTAAKALYEKMVEKRVTASSENMKLTAPSTPPRVNRLLIAPCMIRRGRIHSREKRTRVCRALFQKKSAPDA
jgi:hypothetical protein